MREARVRAGLNQRELARRADTAQSVVARIELGETSPGFGTLERLLAAAGFTIDPRLEPALMESPTALSDVRRILHLTAEQRLQELRNADRFLAAARRV